MATQTATQFLSQELAKAEADRIAGSLARQGFRILSIKVERSNTNAIVEPPIINSGNSVYPESSQRILWDAVVEYSSQSID